MRLFLLLLLSCTAADPECQLRDPECQFGISAYDCPTGLQLHGHNTVIEISYDQINPVADYAVDYWLTTICE
jgi:hypothetical protein